MVKSILRSATQVVSVGSVDGVLTAAAVLRQIGNPSVGLTFTQAFTVEKVPVETWPTGQRVVFVDLAVDNRDPNKTRRFIARLKAGGHTLIAIVDEHSREDWLSVLGTFDGLTVEPRTRSDVYGSSGALLLAALSDEADEHTRMLCAAADAGDKMQFIGIGELANKAMKANIPDDARRVHLARHFATSAEPDAQILAWVKEYDGIEAAHKEVHAAKQDLLQGIHRVVTTGKRIDVTTLMRELYEAGAVVVVMEAELYDKAVGKKVRQIAFGTNSQKLDLLACLKAAGVGASGFAQKANVPPAEEEAALAAVRALLS